MDEPLEHRLRFLRKANTEGMPHSDRGLLDHLLGTRQLLVKWEARPALCDAGLFHSVYGTEYYELQAIPLTMRNEVQQLIGDEAESLAWLFCVIRRASPPPQVSPQLSPAVSGHRYSTGPKGDRPL